MSALHKCAEDGDQTAAFELIRSLEVLEIKEDPDRYVSILVEAAKSFPMASLKLGQFMLQNEPEGSEEIRKHFVRAGQGGLVEAQVFAAEMFLNGRGGPADPEKALSMFLHAAEQGHVGAMYAAAFVLQGRYGRPADPAGSRYWMERAARGGHHIAQFAWGRLLMQEASKEPDHSIVEEAQQWLIRAQKADYKPAIAELRKADAKINLPQSA